MKITNWVYNSRLQTDTAGFTPPSGVTLTWVSAGNMRLSRATNGTMYVFPFRIGSTPTYYPILPGGTIAARARFTNDGAVTIQARVAIFWYNGSLVNIAASNGTAVTINAAANAVAEASGAAPPGAVYGLALFWVLTSAGGTTVTGGSEQAVLSEIIQTMNQPLPAAHFTGATPDTASFDYSWTGTADASPSTRIDLVLQGTFGDTLTQSMNRIAGTTGRSKTEAANIWAGTTDMSFTEALNFKNMSTGLSYTEALNSLAGTTNLSATEAAWRI